MNHPASPPSSARTPRASRLSHVPRGPRRDRGKRAAILGAALREFAAQGLAGARMDAIARAAGVNKALIHYYFADKETLYGATLDYVFSGLYSRVITVLRSDASPYAKLLQYVEAHFDYIARVAEYPQLVQGEMLRPQGSTHIRRITDKYMRPIGAALQAMIAEGVAAGDFRHVDPAQSAASVVAVIVFYFTSRPMLQRLLHFDPLAPDRIAQRRAAVIDFILAALLSSDGNASVARGRSASRPTRNVRVKSGKAREGNL